MGAKRGINRGNFLFLVSIFPFYTEITTTKNDGILLEWSIQIKRQNNSEVLNIIFSITISITLSYVGSYVHFCVVVFTQSHLHSLLCELIFQLWNIIVGLAILILILHILLYLVHILNKPSIFNFCLSHKPPHDWRT